jgi:hypothetical protein
MSQTRADYLARAEEYVGLAHNTKDEMIQRCLLELRQNNLKVAERLPKSTGRGALGIDEINPARMAYGEPKLFAR